MIPSVRTLNGKLQLLQFRLEKLKEAWIKNKHLTALNKLANEMEPLRKYTEEHEIFESIVLGYSTIFWEKMGIFRSGATSIVIVQEIKAGRLNSWFSVR